MTKSELSKICVEIDAAKMRLCIMLTANGAPQLAKLIENYTDEILETLGDFVEQESPMTNDRIAAIRERCAKATPGPGECGEFGFGISSEKRNIYFAYGHDAQVFKDMQFTANSRTDIPYLLTEIDRLTAELAASKRREQAAVELLVKSGFCSQQPLYECDEERPMACHACITKWCLSGPQEGGE